MEFTEFVRQPFKIEATQITEENMEEVCELIGHEIVEDGNTRYIRINRRLVPQGTKAHVGHWVTQMGDNLRCYPNRIFKQQFTPYTEDWSSWFPEEETSESKAPEPGTDEWAEQNPTPSQEVVAEAEYGVATEPVPVSNDSETSAEVNKPQVGDTYVEDVVEPYTGS